MWPKQFYNSSAIYTGFVSSQLSRIRTKSTKRWFILNIKEKNKVKTKSNLFTFISSMCYLRKFTTTNFYKFCVHQTSPGLKLWRSAAISVGMCRSCWRLTADVRKPYTRGNTWQCIETANTVYVHVILYSYVNDIQAPAIWNSVSSYEKYRYHFQGTSENCALSCIRYGLQH